MYCLNRVAAEHSSRSTVISLRHIPPHHVDRLRAPRNCFATMTAIATLMALPHPAFAEPTGGTVVTGSAGISQAGSVTTINQSSNRAIINWTGFSIGAKETVNFQQPNTSSVTLNRVIGNEKSVISGALNANGQVFIVNSAGVLIGKGAQVNVGGLVASTLDIANSDFMAGKYAFSGTSAASVVNRGAINARDGGYVALLGKTVSNDGVITANLGTVAMSSGSKVTLNFDGNSLFDVTIDQGTLNALVENKRAIRADGGRVIMTAKAADAVLSAQVNNKGIVQARTVADLLGGGTKTGSIKMHAYGGKAKVAGTLDASAPAGGKGGFIETSGDQVNIADGAVITTKAASGEHGTWLIDPIDFSIVNGDARQTASGIGVATLEDRLADSNVIITTASGGHGKGDINIDASLSWLASTTLTLNAANNINVNKAVTAAGDGAGLELNAGKDININANVTLTGLNAGLVMTYGGDYNILTPATYSGTVLDRNGEPVAKKAPTGTTYASITLSGDNASLAINGDTYTLIHSMAGLDALDGQNGVTGVGAATTVAGKYALAQDLDATGTTYTTALVSTLDGTFTGLGHTISNLKIISTSPDHADRLGVFGTTTTGSLIRDISVLNVDMSGWPGGLAAGIGALVGWNFADIRHAYSSGTLSSSDNKVGGLVGLNGSDNSSVNTISDSFSTANVTGFGFSGGLVGKAYNVDIVRSHATGNVASTSSGGGLVGSGSNIDITRSYATGTVKGVLASDLSTVSPIAASMGGLVGDMLITSAGHGVVDSFASGGVTGGAGLGGLIGTLNAGGGFTIRNSYATGDVTSYQTAGGNPQGIGGLVGWASSSSDTIKIVISGSHATGDVAYAEGANTGFSGDYAGGLVGNMLQGAGLIENSYATGNATGTTGVSVPSSVGGLVGGSGKVDITNSYATGNVTGGNSVGGLAGTNAGTIRNSHAEGNVNGTITFVGGLVGVSNGSIIGSYATGSVTGGPNGYTGGLVGANGGLISGSYATGLITGAPGLTGGIAGTTYNTTGDPNSSMGRIENSYYNLELNPGLNQAEKLACCALGTVVGGGGLTTSQMRGVQFFTNGTIGQVVSTGQAISTEAQKSSTRLPDERISAAGDRATRSATSEAIDSNLDGIANDINADDERQRRQRATQPKAKAKAAAKGQPRGKREPGYGATIRSIEIDGERYDLQKNAPATAPENGAPDGNPQ
jgi:filamentous hemagglutinin family protein